MYGGVSVWARYCGVWGGGPGWIEVDWEAGGGGEEQAVRGVAGFGSVFQVGGEAALEFRVDPRTKLYILIFPRREN